MAGKGSRRKGYNFSKPSEVRRYRADMSDALQQVNINRPFGVPLRPIAELDAWFHRACEAHGLSPMAVLFTQRQGAV